METDKGTRGDLGRMKTLLMMKAGLVRDSLASSQMFMTRTQYPEEKVSDFAVELKRLFKEACSSDDYTSAILLQRFLTGLDHSSSVAPTYIPYKGFKLLTSRSESPPLNVTMTLSVLNSVWRCPLSPDKNFIYKVYRV